MLLVKKYQYEDLIINKKDLLNRISRIEFFSFNNGLPVSFIHGDCLIRQTKRLSRTLIEYGNILDTHKYQLINLCNQYYNLGLIHGDLNRKNVFLSDNRIIISDWEPSLKQVVNNKVTLMGTHPYFDINDKKNNKLSINTDIMCVYYMLNKPSLSYFQSDEWMVKLNLANVSKRPFDFCVL